MSVIWEAMVISLHVNIEKTNASHWNLGQNMQIPANSMVRRQLLRYATLAASLQEVQGNVAFLGKPLRRVKYPFISEMD